MVTALAPNVVNHSLPERNNNQNKVYRSFNVVKNKEHPGHSWHCALHTVSRVAIKRTNNFYNQFEILVFSSKCNAIKHIVHLLNWLEAAPSKKKFFFELLFI